MNVVGRRGRPARRAISPGRSTWTAFADPRDRPVLVEPDVVWRADRGRRHGTRRICAPVRQSSRGRQCPASRPRRRRSARPPALTSPDASGDVRVPPIEGSVGDARRRRRAPDAPARLERAGAAAAAHPARTTLRRHAGRSARRSRRDADVDGAARSARASTRQHLIAGAAQPCCANRPSSRRRCRLRRARAGREPAAGAAARMARTTCSCPSDASETTTWPSVAQRCQRSLDVRLGDCSPGRVR